MQAENESNAKDVKELQATLFPPTPKKSSYFSNFLIKTTVTIEDEDSVDDEQIKRDALTRELFSLTRESTFLAQPPRWPTECQVLDERVKHIDYIPATPEPYNIPTGKEAQPKPSGDECGVIVFQYTPISAVNYFSRSSIGGSKYLLTSCLCPEEDTLRFESRFECGNLERAIRITPNYYELYLRSDLYTNRHMQWFYFRVTNTKKNFLYRFSIANFSKEDSLYNEGMRPLMYSVKDSQLHSIGWRRCGENVTYFSNDNVSPEDPEAQMTYTFTFTTEFPHDDDEIYFAHCYPYTYSDLEDYLLELANHPIKSTFTTVRLLCKTLAGNNVHYVTITSPPVSGEAKKKRAVVVTARVHPGETPSSWMMKGFLDFLTSDGPSAKELRDKFIFKLVPMLNPDGVIVGNNRCSLSAKDLNRQYRTVMRDAYPSIWYTKLMVRRLLEECGVAMYCDLHAHSRKHNIFIYGCENRRGNDRKLQEQVFPLMLHKNAADKFSFESCKFRIQKAKEGTGRVVMWMMGIANSYTMETSFAGSILGNRAETHFSTLDFELMGRSFCQTLLDFYDEHPRKEKLRVKIINRLMKGGSNADEPTNIQLSDYSSDEGDTSSSSTSSNEVGRDEEEEILPVPPPSPVITKKVPKTRIRAKTTANNKKEPKSPNVVRKPLPICKATLGLSLTIKKSFNCSSASSSDSDEEVPTKIEKIKRRKPRKRHKPTSKKKQGKNSADTEIKYTETTTVRSISVFDLIPSEKLNSAQINSTKRSKTPQPRTARNVTITQQLSEVQAKLITLKNKLWFGVGDDGDDDVVNAPLSWGISSFSPPLTLKKKAKKNNKNNTQDKSKIRQSGHVETMTKKIPGLRRQSAVVRKFDPKMKKSKSLPDNTSSLMNTSEKNKLKICISCDEEDKVAIADLGTKKKKTKNKKTKLAKKVKTLGNAKIFLSNKD